MPDMHKTSLLSGFKGIDIFLLIPVVLLCTIGVIFIYSGSQMGDDAMKILIRHLVLLGIGLVFMLFGIFVDHSFYRKVYSPVFLASLFMLFAVLCFGHRTYGAVRWISIAGFQFQPSEVMKFALCSFLAYHLSTFKKWKDLTRALVFTIVTVVLILAQPNFSMFLFIVGLCFLFMICANFPWKFLGSIVAVVVLLGAIVGFSGGYRMERFNAWIHPEEYVDGKGYQQHQMKVSIGNGGAWGQGIGYGTQKNGFIAFSYKDGMFALVAEEGGFKVASIVLLCFLCILWRGYEIAKNANSKYARLMALGLTSFIFMNALMHVAVCTGRMPATGQPLPFISYGGTNLIMNMFFVGVLLNISKQHTGRFFKFEEVASDFDVIECEHPTSRFRSV